MYAHSFLVTSVRGRGELPTTGASSELGVIGFMKAALGTRFVPDFFRDDFLPAFLADDFFAVRFFPADFFLPELFFFVAIASPGERNGAANGVTPMRVWPAR